MTSIYILDAKQKYLNIMTTKILKAKVILQFTLKLEFLSPPSKITVKISRCPTTKMGRR